MNQCCIWMVTKHLSKFICFNYFSDIPKGLTRSMCRVLKADTFDRYDCNVVKRLILIRDLGHYSFISLINV